MKPCEIALLLALLAPATASAQLVVSEGTYYMRIVVSEDKNGSVIQVMEIPDLKCGTDINGASLGGCYRLMPIIAGYGLDREARRHELEHAAGLIHDQPWRNFGNGDNCVRIIEAGYTKWTPGKLMCGGTDGRYYEVNP